MSIGEQTMLIGRQRKPMLHFVLACLCVVTFGAAGTIDDLARPAQRESFVRLGDPAW